MWGNIPRRQSSLAEEGLVARGAALTNLGRAREAGGALFLSLGFYRVLWGSIGFYRVL